MFALLKTKLSSKPLLFLYLLSIIFAFVVVLRVIVIGTIPFWYDPARDLLSALQNLHKLTLIGPPSGIPGVFYGPYWIWLLSFGLLFSKNPRVVDIIVLTIPYFVIFPLILFQFRKIFSIGVIIVIWQLFIIHFNGYSSQIWNPSLAPLCSLIVIYLLALASVTNWNKKLIGRFLLAGMIEGLALNFHLSFGIGFITGIYIFFLIQIIASLLKRNHWWKIPVAKQIYLILLFTTGVAIMFVPFFLFEVRHGFTQILTAIKTISSSTAVVSQIGLSKKEIIDNFIGRLGIIFEVPLTVAYIIAFGIIAFTVYIFKKVKITILESQLAIFLVSTSLSVLFIYLTSKNPVWQYHFINIEILLLLLIGFIINKLPLTKYFVFFCVLIYSSLFIIGFYRSFSINPISIPSLVSEEYKVKTIDADAQGNSYSMFAYNQSIYMYDYSYLFSWMLGKNFSYDPSQIPQHQKLVYLIIPPTKKAIQEDFIDYRTPNKFYKTERVWHIDDGDLILKRVIK